MISVVRSLLRHDSICKHAVMNVTTVDLGCSMVGCWVSSAGLYVLLGLLVLADPVCRSFGLSGLCSSGHKSRGSR